HRGRLGRRPLRAGRPAAGLSQHAARRSGDARGRGGASGTGGSDAIMIEIRRIDHVALRVANLDEAEHRGAIQFGLTEVERVGHHAFLRCAYEPYSVQLVGAGAPGHDHTGWEPLRSCTIDHDSAPLDRHGVDYEHNDGALHFSVPDGYGIELMP